MKRNYANLKADTRTTTMQGTCKSDTLINNNKVVKSIIHFWAETQRKCKQCTLKCNYCHTRCKFYTLQINKHQEKHQSAILQNG